MRKVSWLAWAMALGLVSSVSAQEDSVKKYVMTTVMTNYGWSNLDLTDAYLTELPYTGYGLHYNSSSRTFLSPADTTISYREDFCLNGGEATNSAQSAFITYIGGSFGWGLQGHWKPTRNLQLLLGGGAETELGMKIYSRDVNNAFNMDWAFNVNALATLRYSLPWKHHRNIRLQADLRTPLLGLMFVPVRGESYSEIFYLGSTDHLFHVTSLTNKNGLNARFLIQLPLKSVLLNLGLQSDFLRYAANDMVFSRHITSFTIGTTFDRMRFGGKKNKAPASFISSEW